MENLSNQIKSILDEIGLNNTIEDDKIIFTSSYQQTNVMGFIRTLEEGKMLNIHFQIANPANDNNFIVMPSEAKLMLRVLQFIASKSYFSPIGAWGCDLSDGDIRFMVHHVIEDSTMSVQQIKRLILFSLKIVHSEANSLLEIITMSEKPTVLEGI